MNKQTKAKLLQAIHAGDIPISYLKPRQFIVFEEIDNGYQGRDGKFYTEEEVKEITSAIEDKNRAMSAYLNDPDTEDIIVFIRRENRHSQENSHNYGA